MSDFSVKPVLTGDRTVLRPFTEADAAVMAEIIEDPEVIRFTGDSADEFTEERLRSWYGSRSDQPDRLDLAVTDRATGELVGEVVLYVGVPPLERSREWGRDPKARGCTFRTLIGPRGRGRGIGTEATRLVVGHGFEQLALHRIQLEAYGHNPRALRVYEKVGFVVEGVRREADLRDGQWRDWVMMAILDREWTAHRGHPDLTALGSRAR